MGRYNFIYLCIHWSACYFFPHCLYISNTALNIHIYVLYSHIFSTSGIYLMLQTCEELPYCFLNWLLCFTFLPIMYGFLCTLAGTFNYQSFGIIDIQMSATSHCAYICASEMMQHSIFVCPLEKCLLKSCVHFSIELSLLYYVVSITNFLSDIVYKPLFLYFWCMKPISIQLYHSNVPNTSQSTLTVS